jgi:ankyrin repeat protein
MDEINSLSDPINAFKAIQIYDDYTLIDLLEKYGVSPNAAVDVLDHCTMKPVYKLSLLEVAINRADERPCNTFEENLETTKILVEHGADVNMVIGSGASLHHAACIDYENIVEYLLNNGADVNKVNKSGLTPLHITAIHIHYGTKYKSMKLLIKHGADLSIRDRDGKRPIDYAKGKALKILRKFS